MRNKKRYDEEIRPALLYESNQIEASHKLFEKIKNNIYELEGQVTMKNKKRTSIKGRRLVAMIASFILIGSLTVLGVREGKSWLSYTDQRYKTFPSQERILKDVGFVPKYPQSLPGGFEFLNGGTGESTLSDSGDVLIKSKELTLAYKRQNEKSALVLSVSQIDEVFVDNASSELAGNVDGIDLYYYEQLYKFLPIDYELTEEDKRAQEAGELEISYGSSEVAYNNIQALSWYKDGLSYNIMGSDFDFSLEEMIGMMEAVME